MAKGHAADEKFVPGSILIDGLFQVSRLSPQAKVKAKSASFTDPLFFSWSTKPGGLLRGGVHALAVENLPSEPNLVRLWFVSFISLSGNVSMDTKDPVIDPSPPFFFGTLLAFHRFYSQVLFDCAVRKLQRNLAKRR